VVRPVVRPALLAPALAVLREVPEVSQAASAPALVPAVRLPWALDQIPLPVQVLVLVAIRAASVAPVAVVPLQVAGLASGDLDSRLAGSSLPEALACPGR
jgi:hypothetical protein